jgi:hypothetical protein
MATELTDRQLLECAIAAYTAAGWRIVSQTEHGFEAAQPRDLSMLGLGVLVWAPTVIACLVFFVAPMLGMGILALAGIGLLIVLLDYAIQHEERPKPPVGRTIPTVLVATSWPLSSPCESMSCATRTFSRIVTTRIRCGWYRGCGGVPAATCRALSSQEGVLLAQTYSAERRAATVPHTM